uniref:C-mannosyltransferase DPY19L3 n=2 Tax=Macrostomum lignano TaxID=282301 RepID=A0A1I8JBA3_9PLAT
MGKFSKAKRQRSLSGGASSALEAPGGPPSGDLSAAGDSEGGLPGWLGCLATVLEWTAGIGLMLGCAWGFAWLTNEIHESTLYFSNIKEVEREISLRTEQGLYYSYYKQLVWAPSLRQGLFELVRDNSTEHPDTINVLSRMNIYQEVLLALLYRYTWFGTYLQPIYFYIYSVLFLNGLLICGLFATSWQLTGTPLAGCLAAVMYTLNSMHTTRLSSTHALREHFSLPFLWLQLFCLSVYFSRASVRGSARERVSLLGAQICCFLFTLFWQFNQFVLLLQSLSVLTASAIGFVQFRKAFAFLLTVAGSLLLVSLLQFGNPMLLTAPALSVCLSGALSVAVSRRWLLPGFGSAGRLARLSRVACQAWVCLLAFAVCQTVLKLVIRHDADSHIYKFVMMKLGYGYDDDFDVRMYNCAGAFVWLPWSTFTDLAATYLLQPYLIVHAALFLLTLAGFLHSLLRPPDAASDADEANGVAASGDSAPDSGGKFERPSAWREALDGFARHPELAYHAVQCTVFAILGYTTLRMKYFWTPYMCVLMPLALGHRRCWDWLLLRLLGPRLRHAGFAWSQILTLALLVSSARTCYRDNQAVWQNLREFWDPDTVQLMEWISSATPPDAAFTGSMQLLAGVKCCTGRRITNHPHYEDRALREKTRQLYQIYGRKPPHEVHRILRSHGSDFIILEDSICLRPGNGCGTTELVDNLNGELTDLQARQPQAPPGLRRSSAPRFCHEIRRSHGASPEENPYARLFQLVLENRTFRVYRLL